MGEPSKVTMVEVKIQSVHAECPHCGNDQHVDVSEFESDKFKAFNEYETSCDQCDRYFEFKLDVL